MQVSDAPTTALYTKLRHDPGERVEALAILVERAGLQEAESISANGQRGVLQVVYLDARPPEAEDPFLSEERSLIESLGRMVNVVLCRRVARSEVRQIGAEPDRRIALPECPQLAAEAT
jgi:hypothetical protein